MRRSGTRPGLWSGSGPRSRRSRSPGTATRWRSGTRSRSRATAIMVAGESMARGGPLRDRSGRHLRRGPPGQGRPAVRDGQADGAGRPVDGRDPPRPLLRQGPEPGPHRHRRLRRGPGRPRPAGHADPAAEGDRAPRARLPDGGLCGQGSGDDPEHRPLRRHRPPGHERPLRHVAGAAHRHDAGRSPRRRDHHPASRRLRTPGVPPRPTGAASLATGRQAEVPRWRIERTIAWLLGWRRLRVRYERGDERFFTFAMLACSAIMFNTLQQPPW